jgi:hypothetical protein
MYIFNLSIGNLNLNNIESQKVEKRKVKFQPAVRVVLIPSRTEYIASNLLVTLWWSDIDYSAFKNSAVMELKAVMRSNSISNSKEAIRLLYQPNFDENCGKIVIEKSVLIPKIVDPPMIEYMDDPPKSLKIIPEENDFEGEDSEIKNELFERKCDLQLIDHYNFTKIHPNAEVSKKLHPLAYLCN